MNNKKQKKLCFLLSFYFLVEGIMMVTATANWAAENGAQETSPNAQLPRMQTGREASREMLEQSLKDRHLHNQALVTDEIDMLMQSFQKMQNNPYQAKDKPAIESITKDLNTLKVEVKNSAESDDLQRMLNLLGILTAKGDLTTEMLPKWQQAFAVRNSFVPTNPDHEDAVQTLRSVILVFPQLVGKPNADGAIIQDLKNYLEELKKSPPADGSMQLKNSKIIEDAAVVIAKKDITPENSKQWKDIFSKRNATDLVPFPK